MKKISFPTKTPAGIAGLAIFVFLLFSAERVPAQLRSDDSSDRQVWVEFENTFPQPVNLIWVDFSGVEQSIQWLEPGQSLRQQTTEHHAWLFRNRDDRVLGSYAATGVAGQKCRIGMPAPWVGPRPGAEWISERGGRFVNGAEARWIYVSPSGIPVYEFDEEERIWEYVSLFDPVRGERVRLYPDKLLVCGPGERDWRFDANGQWNEGDEPELTPFPGGEPAAPQFPPPSPYGGSDPHSPRSSMDGRLPPPGPSPPGGPPADYTPPPAPGLTPSVPPTDYGTPSAPGPGAGSAPGAGPGFPPPVPVSSPRSRWDSNEGGHYQKMGNKKWAEYSAQGAAPLWLEEQETTDRYVSLYDRQRDLWIRIYDDRVLAFPSGASSWEKRVSGGWTR